MITVDENDQITGLLDKLQAHQKGVLHRAVSVLIFNSKGEWLIQQRNLQKYHSGGLWSNTACSHPYFKESNLKCAERRLEEEMGMKCSLEKKFSFIYKANLENGLIEHEYDHVYFGTSDELPNINKEEVAEYQYISTPKLLKEFELNGDVYSEWFKLIVKQVLDFQ